MSARDEELKAARSRAQTKEELATRAEAIAAKSQAEATRLRRQYHELETPAAREEWMQAQFTANVEAQIARDARFQAYCATDHTMGWEGAIKAFEEIKQHRAERAARLAAAAQKTEEERQKDAEAEAAEIEAEYAEADAAELKKFRVGGG